MAKYVGKGWFAVLLGNHINYLTEIPNYILDAILFSKGEFSNDLIYDIVKYRLNKIVEDENNKNLDLKKAFDVLEEFIIDKKNLLDLIESIKSSIDYEDQILIFLERLEN